jgi:hypothetical protein
MAKKIVAKSAETGKIVSKKFAKENPATTFETPVEEKKAKAPKEVPAYLPMLGEKFELDGRIAEVVSFDPLLVIEHAVINGCQTQSKFEVESLDGASYLAKDEAFRRLA